MSGRRWGVWRRGHLFAEVVDLVEDVGEAGAEGAEGVLDAGRGFGVDGALEDAEAEHLVEAFVEDLVGEPGDGSAELAGSMEAAADLREDVQGPLAGEDGLEDLGEAVGVGGFFCRNGLG